MTSIDSPLSQIHRGVDSVRMVPLDSISAVSKAGTLATLAFRTIFIFSMLIFYQLSLNSLGMFLLSSFALQALVALLSALPGLQVSIFDLIPLVAMFY